MSGNDDSHSQRRADKPSSVHSHETANIKGRRRTKYDILEEGWNKKFGDLSSRIDFRLARTMPAPQRHLHVESVYSGPGSISEDETSKQDVLSISASGRISDSENDSVQFDENNNETNRNLPEPSKECLYDIFGEDAGVKKTVKKVGFAIDQSQKDVLETSYRASEQNFGRHFQKTILTYFLLFRTLKNTWKFRRWIH